MGVQKAVYVREEDVQLWRRAEAYAKARRLSMSALVMTALEQFLADAGDTPVPRPRGGADGAPEAGQSEAQRDAP
ncbi:hypothetical protein [Phytoactinopolyspora halotolerans]|uniref:Uncharacterized protein n=1 Tax=Phytoactinopolyspora halotolerans TaxID=1981512 RepID=A0A6L9S2N9_9ACTN|nr:hypothetical protein [Phytoactinopolyspora halotolerans]NED99312.1 hypothetical protein [Phytoactinopolyspora halotolerans]